jgi:hypothetical protein
MEKYKRFFEEVKNDEEIQTLFNKLTTEGWNIIYYNEKIKNPDTMNVTIVCKQTINMKIND